MCYRLNYCFSAIKMQPSELDLSLLPFYQLATNYSPALALQFKETSALLSSVHALPFGPLSAPSASPDSAPSLEAKACSLRVPLALEQLLVLSDTWFGSKRISAPSKASVPSLVSGACGSGALGQCYASSAECHLAPCSSLTSLPLPRPGTPQT